MTTDRTRRAWLGALTWAAAGSPLRAAEPAGAQRKPWPAGQAAPSLVLPAWDGPPVRLADARGQVVVVNFWASWCEPCRSEMPTLELLEQRHEKDKLKVLAVNYRETDAAIRHYLAQWPITLTILRDADGAAAKAWQARAFPTTVVVGRDGRPAFTVVGELDWTGPLAREWMASVL